MVCPGCGGSRPAAGTDRAGRRRRPPGRALSRRVPHGAAPGPGRLHLPRLCLVLPAEVRWLEAGSDRLAARVGRVDVETRGPRMVTEPREVPGRLGQRIAKCVLDHRVLLFVANSNSRALWVSPALDSHYTAAQTWRLRSSDAAGGGPPTLELSPSTAHAHPEAPLWTLQSGYFKTCAKLTGL